MMVNRKKQARVGVFQLMRCCLMSIMNRMVMIRVTPYITVLPTILLVAILPNCRPGQLLPAVIHQESQKLPKLASMMTMLITVMKKKMKMIQMMWILILILVLQVIAGELRRRMKTGRVKILMKRIIVKMMMIWIS
nr:hypothetical protein Iba_chr07dCG6260 [Ipomoea batatas]GMD19260.1 hypothetical protein Iba_chr07eCG6540 [Ipomoea batatas]